MQWNRKIIWRSLIILFISTGIITYKVIEKSVINKEKFNSQDLDINSIPNDNYETNNKEDNMKNIKVNINDRQYNATIENNETAKVFLNWLPKEFAMKELNGNEKYVYMDKSLPTNAISQEHIQSGDIMLYGSDCLVIFYKSFDTNYNYTKIGHIDNLTDLGSDSIMVKFERGD